MRNENILTPVPLYAKIKHHIKQCILAGKLSPNDQVPSENTLVKEFNVSRMTVHRALRELKEEGVVVRVSGVGTFVADVQPKGRLITVKNIAQEIRERGHDYSSEIIQNRSEKATADVSQKIDANVGCTVFHSIIVHKADGIAVQLEDRYVLGSALPGYGSVDFTATTPNEYLMTAAPLQQVEHCVKAILPDKKTERLLGIKSDDPCLLLIRKTWSDGRIVSLAWLTHPSSRFEFVDTFKP